MNEEDPLLDIEQAARECKLSQSSLYDACKKKLLTHHRLSGSGRRGAIRIRRSALLAWIESNKVEAVSGPKPAARPAKLPSLDL